MIDPPRGLAELISRLKNLTGHTFITINELIALSSMVGLLITIPGVVTDATSASGGVGRMHICIAQVIELLEQEELNLRAGNLSIGDDDNEQGGDEWQFDIYVDLQ